MKPNKYLMIILTIIFLLPGILAYFLYDNSQWLANNKTTNKGKLLTPVKLDNTAQKKWRLIFYTPKDCGDSCLMQLDKLARLRLLLGRKLYNVELALLINNELSKKLTDNLNEQDIKIVYNLSLHDIKMLSKNDSVFLQDPNGYLILKYELYANSKDILHDIKHLLNQEG